jgi:hypothetical protein
MILNLPVERYVRTYRIKRKVINTLQRRIHRDDFGIVVQMDAILGSLGRF